LSNKKKAPEARNKAQQLEQGAQTIDALFRSVTVTATDAIISITGDENIILWNPAAEQMFGYSSEEAVGQPISIIMPDRFRQTHKKGINRFFETGRSKIVGKSYEACALKKNGSEFPVELSLSSWEQDENVYFTGIIRDITKRKKLEDRLRETSLTDELTGLLNRRGFITLSEKQLQISKRYKKHFSILFLDLNDMKTINDEFGHKTGDLALTDVADILKKTFRSSDIIARIGGDEFTVLMVESQNSDIQKHAVKNILKNVRIHNNKMKRSYRLSFSIGISNFDPENPCSIDDLLVQADTLMYENKKHKFKTDDSHGSEEKNRAAERFTANTNNQAEIVISGDVRVKNISREGICLITSHLLKQHGVYRIRTIGKKNEGISVKGKVVWSSARWARNREGIPAHFESGLQFFELTDQAKSQIEIFISASC
jgi:diguanylate cyclase (GGDEF)-like protein/PAS domain S-box-containing protein